MRRIGRYRALRGWAGEEISQSQVSCDSPPFQSLAKTRPEGDQALERVRLGSYVCKTSADGHM